MGTPRRLVLHAGGLDEKQPDTVVEITGPAKRAAFDENNKPLKAAEGFSKAHGVNVNDLNCQDRKGRIYLCKKGNKRKEDKGNTSGDSACDDNGDKVPQGHAVGQR